MTDYISRQAAIDSVWRAVELDNSYAMKHQIYTDLKTIPSADVVEVVRCKDCRYWNNKVDLTYCEKKTWLGTDADDYCSFGERADK